MKTSNTNHLSMSSSNLKCESEAFFNSSSLVLPSNLWANNKNGIANSSSTRTSVNEPFGNYFQKWLVDQERNLVDLRMASTESSSVIESVVGRVMSQYEDYYKVKSESIENDGVYMLNAPWLTPLEHTFQWLGGWRATTTFHLLYTVVGLQLEARLSDFLQLGSLSHDDLMAMTSTQMALVDKLQMLTIRQERELSEALASAQETLVDSSMVQLSHLATTIKDSLSLGKLNEQVKLNLRAKENKLKELISKADDLRLSMFKNVVHILTPLQAAHFLIAAAELHLKLHEWGHRNYNHPAPAVADLLIKITPLLLIN